MSRARKGSPVVFAPVKSIHHDPDPVLGLRFMIEARHGGNVDIDMTDLAPRPLAIAFAGALRRSASMGGPIGAASVIKQHLLGYRRFFAWIAAEAPEISSAHGLRTDHIDAFEAALERGGMGAIHRHTVLAKIVNALRTIETDRPDAIAPGLHERLRYTASRSAGRSTPRDAYSPFVARAIRDAARSDVEAMFRRLGRDDSTDAGDPVIAAARRAIEEIIAKEGAIHSSRRAFRSLYFMRLRRGLPLSALIEDLNGRHHVLTRDLPALLALLVLDTGLEPECVKGLALDCLHSPGAGTVELRYFKRRARGAEHKSMRVRDGGVGTPGGLIRRLFKVMAPARQHVPTDCLWVFHHNGRLRSGIANPAEQLAAWVARHGLVDDDGRPLNLLLSRLRKTHKALWYAKTEGHMARFAVGHSREVAARHYADLPSLRRLHEATVADAFRDVVASTAPIVLTPANEQALRSEPDGVAGLIAPGNIAPLLDGEQDVWLAACAGFYRSPFSESGSPCAQPFWGCLDCSNAVITARKLPAILAFLAFIEDQRRGLSEADWTAKFGHAHARITRQILPTFSDAVIAESRQQMDAHDLYLPPEALA